MKQAIIVLALMMAASAASAAGYGIVGGIAVKPDGQPTIIIPFDGTELFLSEADCDVQRAAYLTAKVKFATSAETGELPAYSTWRNAKVTKIDATKCIKVTP